MATNCSWRFTFQKVRNFFANVVPDRTARTLFPVMEYLPAAKSTVTTDGLPAYSKLVIRSAWMCSITLLIIWRIFLSRSSVHTINMECITNAKRVEGFGRTRQINNKLQLVEFIENCRLSKTPKKSFLNGFWLSNQLDVKMCLSAPFTSACQEEGRPKPV